MATDLTHACARCGETVPGGARFCPSCGASQYDVPREERRVVTIMFADLSGFTELSERLDPEEVKRIVDGAIERISALVSAYGGRVDKIIGDEVMAVFGAPLAHEDDPERAVRAALAVQSAIEAYAAEPSEREIDLRIHIGINTGEVVAGLVGGSDSYSVIGDAVNTARRIADEATAGQTLVGETTHEATRTAIEHKRLGHVTPKGKRRPVAIWEAVRERALPGERVARPSPLVGRDEELAVLDAFARMVRRDGRPLAVAVIGEAGMGKSRLVNEFARRLSEEGGRVLHGRSLPYGTASPAFAVEQIVRAALMLDPSLPAQQAEAWVHERTKDLGLEPEADRLCALLGISEAPITHEGAATGPAATSAPPAGGTSGPLDAARALVERIAEREGFLAIAFHELHWAEDAILDLVQSLLRNARAPLLVITLARPGLLDRRPAWSRSLGTALLSLQPLPRARAEELLDLLAPNLSPRLRENVLDRAGGNPLYLQELTRLLLERDDPADPWVPAGLHALVAARLDALPAGAKLMLQDAATVGEEFWPGALRQLRPEAAEEVEPTMRLLAERGFVEPSTEPGPLGELGWRFNQELVREVAYGSVPKQVRAMAHMTVASWLEEGAAASDRDLSDLIAHHYEHAARTAREVGEPRQEAEQKARTFLERAGDQARLRDAASVAADFYARALAFAEEADALTLRLHLGEALLAIWDHEPAEVQLRRVLEDARAQDARAHEGKALRLLGDLYRMRGEPARATEPLARALAIAKEIGDSQEEAEGLRSHGLLDLHRGRWSSATLWFRQALARYRHPMLGDARGEGWSLQNLGWANLLLGRLDEARSYLEEGEEVFTGLGDDEGVGWCLSLKSWVHLMHGDLTEADGIAQLLEGALAELRQAPTFELDIQRTMRAYVAVLRGRLADAEAFANAAISGASAHRATWVRGLSSYPKFFAAMLRLRYADARVAAEDGARLAAASGDPLYAGQFAFARAWLALEEGRPGEVAGLLERFATVGGASEPEGTGVRWLLARTTAAQGRRTEARAMLERSIGRQSIVLVPPAMARATLAELQLADGDTGAALATARAALEDAGEVTIARAFSLLALSAAALSADDASEAERAARDALALLEDTDWDVQRIGALGALARALDARRRFDEAAEAIDRARALLDTLPPGTDREPLEMFLSG